MKLYTFTIEDQVIEEVRADNHDHALTLATDPRVIYGTAYYAETIEPNHAAGLCEAVDNLL